MVEITEAQKEKLAELNTRVEKIGNKIGAKMGTRLVIGCAIIIGLNQTIAHSGLFVFFMSIVTGICVTIITKNELLEEQAKIDTEFRNILDNK